MENIRVILLDDHKVVRDGIKIAFSGEKSIRVVGEAIDEMSLMQLLENVIADIIMMDIAIPGKSGIELTSWIVEQYPEIKVIVFSAHTGNDFVLDAINAGAKGFLSKDVEGEEIVRSIKSVYYGKSCLSNTISNSLVFDVLSKEKNDSVSACRAFYLLTTREVEIMRYIAEGYANREIADKLNISFRTVETHRNAIMKKLGMKSVVELVKIAIRKKLIEI